MFAFWNLQLGGDVSDPHIREAVLDSLPEDEAILIDSIKLLRYRCGLVRFTNKQVRNALESLYYGHSKIKLLRPRIDEFTRGWYVRKIVES